VTVRLRPAAEADLAAITRSIAADNPGAARRWVADIRRHCDNLGARPGTGVASPDIHPDLRVLPVGRYLICYVISPEGVDIVRVLHSARQREALLAKGRE